MKVSVEAKIPLFGASKQEYSFELNLEANQQKTITETKTFKDTKSVKVFPKESVKVSSYIDLVEDIKLDFECKLRVSATKNHLSKDNTVRKVPVSTDYLINYIRKAGFTATLIENRGLYLFT